MDDFHRHIVPRRGQIQKSTLRGSINVKFAHRQSTPIQLSDTYLGGKTKKKSKTEMSIEIRFVCERKGLVSE